MEQSVQVPKRRHGVKKTVKIHLRRIGLEVINMLFNHDLLFYILGAFNRRFHFIKSVFLVYPATEEYALAYVYPSRLPMVRWHPWLGGVHMQNGKLIIMFVISSHDRMFANPDNRKNLLLIARRMEEIKKLFQADQKTFAGILPGIMSRERIIRNPPEAMVTAHAVKQAIDEVLEKKDLPANTPLIILGGNGFIGTKVISLLPKEQQYFSIDIENKDFWPTELSGKPIVVINITVKSEVATYISKMWPGTIVLNEVYPEPNDKVLQKMSEQGVSCYHVVGIKPNFAFPSFPRAYHGAIPCCSAFITKGMEVVVKKLN